MYELSDDLSLGAGFHYTHLSSKNSDDGSYGVDSGALYVRGEYKLNDDIIPVEDLRPFVSADLGTDGGLYYAAQAGVVYKNKYKVALRYSCLGADYEESIYKKSLGISLAVDL